MREKEEGYDTKDWIREGTDTAEKQGHGDGGVCTCKL